MKINTAFIPFHLSILWSVYVYWIVEMIYYLENLRNNKDYNLFQKEIENF